jgi:hypothetical protein
MGKEHRPARFVGAAALLVLAGCVSATPPMPDISENAASSVSPTASPAGPTEPDPAADPASAESADRIDSSSEAPSAHEMELEKQSVIADWRLSHERRKETPARTAAAQAAPPAPTARATREQAPAPPQQPPQNAGPVVPCSMLPATATPCLRQ